jgi:hypothetical protein
MLSGGAERDLVRVETSSLDAVSAALHAETGRLRPAATCAGTATAGTASDGQS